jgi:hypothetical protein
MPIAAIVAMKPSLQQPVAGKNRPASLCSPRRGNVWSPPAEVGGDHKGRMPVRSA